MKNLMDKVNNKILALMGAGVALFTLIVGVLTLSGGNFDEFAGSNIGLFINSLIVCALFLLFAYEIYKEDKKKSTVLFLILFADYILVSFGSAISGFANAGNAGGIGIAVCIFEGLGALAVFVAGCLHLTTRLSDNVSAESLNKAAALLFFVGAGCFFLTAIFSVCVQAYGQGLFLATSFFGFFTSAIQAAFFGFASNKLVD